MLIFLHLPKTGGSSLREFLKAKCGHEKYYEIYWNEAAGLRGKDYLNKFIALPREERDRFDLILGHFPYGLHRFLSRPCVYVTLLRNPLERFCSFYQQLINEHHRAHEFSVKNYSIENFLKNWKNRESASAQAEIYFSDMVFNTLQRKDNEVEWDEAAEAQDPQALQKKLRDQFTLVGLMERLDDFVFMLCRMMGWPPGTLGYENKNPGRLSAGQMLSPEQVDQANKILSTEWALYRLAEEIFQRKWKRLAMSERIYARCAHKTAALLQAVRPGMVQRAR